MNLFADIKTLVTDTLAVMAEEGALPADLDLSNITVEPPRDAGQGDMATNAAMVLAKQARMKPRDLAEELVARIAGDARVNEVTVAGPGFINLRLTPETWRGAVSAALSAGNDFGRSTMGGGRKVNVEYVSANPTGPLHVGHTRGAVFGDALARLLDHAGWDVTKEYYINDGGGQIDTLARSVHMRYREANGTPVEIAEGLYPGDYLIPVGEALAAEFGDRFMQAPEEEWLDIFRERATEAMMALIREDLGALGVTMDLYFSEKSLYGTGRIEAAIADLDSKGLIYEGVLEPPKGKVPEDWEPRPQTLFKSTDYGDDVDRPIKKSDGAWTYFAPDIAYHYDKVTRGFDALIDVFGADHSGYVKRMKAAVAALSEEKIPLDIKLCQLVRLFKNGEPFKMSKRAGTFIMLRDVIDEVGPDVTRFIMLTRKNDAPLDFDFDKAREQTRENPVWYVQYASARTHSVFARAAAEGITVSDSDLDGADLSRLDHEADMALIRKIAEFPRLVEMAAHHNEPHRIAFYLYDLASEFHAHWNLGGADPALRAVQPDALETSLARLALYRAVRVVIFAGLGILGVTPMTEMQ
ncbi:arginine--tRNA ligase [Rhodobacteraceae bacterium NNCM2]|nr:arginine--tRNA ligase [Coraliihabitans acroporae]